MPFILDATTRIWVCAERAGARQSMPCLPGPCRATAASGGPAAVAGPRPDALFLLFRVRFFLELPLRRLAVDQASDRPLKVGDVAQPRIGSDKYRRLAALLVLGQHLDGH